MTPTKPQPEDTRITLSKSGDYRDSYANSVQVRLSVWDFFLVFGTVEQPVPEQVNIHNFQGIYLSPQQAKALHNVLSHNIAQYETMFGAIALDGIHAEAQKFVLPGDGTIH
jgi:flagellar protein FlaG